MPAFYNEKFMAYAAMSSRYAASKIVGLVNDALHVKSVLDIGCAGGEWLNAWHAGGVENFHGIDGEYVRPDFLKIPQARFTSANLAKSFSLGKRFDLVQSLEVAEHIEPAATEIFIENIVRHAERFVLFSAAVPGQGGENHLNEQQYDFWRQQFVARDFSMFDFVRPLVAGDRQISFWYRYNVFLFVRNACAINLASRVAITRIEAGQAISDVSPWWFQLRKKAVSSLPNSTQTLLAKCKARVAPTGRF
jgi:hypothetical protein